MKKSVFFLLALICTTVQAQRTMSLDPIADGWETKSIKVKNGGKAPNILQLTSAFQQVWPTYSGGELMKFSKSKAKYNNTDKVVDIKNGFMTYAEDDPDAESDEGMTTCVWRRQNGHSLFAVTFYRMTPSERVVLCFYDYDPKTQTMTPDKSLSNLFEPSFPGYRYRVFLPQIGKNLSIEEFYGYTTIKHTYGWDGMSPVNPKTEIDRMYMYEGTFKAEYPVENEHPFTQYTMLDIDVDGAPELLLQSDDGKYMAAFSVRLTLDLLGGQDGKRQLSFYKDAVCSSGSCGVQCLSSDYVFLEESSPKTYFRIYQGWDHVQDRFGGKTYFLDGKNISVAQGKEIIESLGVPADINLQWKKLN